jgi:branched-chain amino acid transport system permease protein
MSVNTTTTADGQAPAKKGVSLPAPAAASTNTKIMRTAGVILLAIGVAAPFLSGNFMIFQLTMMMIYAIAILGLNILTGINGQFSLGHGAFYAVGAYTAAIMMDQFGIGYLWTLPVAGIICFVVGFLFGLPALRLEGVYLALATFALAVVTPQLFKLSPFEHWTSGVMGIVISKPDAPFGLPLNPDQWLYFLTFAIGLLAYVCAKNWSAAGPAVP